MSEIKSLLPLYGDNYRAGYVGFSFTGGSVLSCGITYFTRWDHMSDIKVSHTFIVRNATEVIEAEPKGVVVNPIKPYFDDPHVKVFFREPRDYTDELGARIVKTAESFLGQKYGYGLIVADAIGNSVFGKLLGIRRLLCKWFDSKKAMICSELGANVLAAQPEFEGIGCLRRPAREIEPQDLFEDDAIFKPWRKT